MNANNKSRFFSIIIVLLLLINTGAITFLLLKKRQNNLPSIPPPPGDAFNFLVRELKLNPSQISNYHTLKENHHELVELLRDKLKNNKDSLFQLLKSNNIGDISVQVKLDSIASINKQIDEITFNHLKQVRSLCNINQQQKFDKIIAQAMHIQAQGKPPHFPPKNEEEQREANENEEDLPPPPNR